jgi:hypothetical protein
MEEYFIINKLTKSHYNTIKERFFSSKYKCPLNTKEYCTALFINNAEKFKNCEIIKK